MTSGSCGLQFSRDERVVMNGSAFVAIFLGTLLSLNPTISLPSGDKENDATHSRSNLEYVYWVTTNVMDDVKESTLTIKLKCREFKIDSLACILEDPQYQMIYHVSPCNKSIEPLCDKDHLRADNSYTGCFEIKYRSSSVDKLITSWSISPKQLNFYRIIADLLFPGVDVSDKPEGTYSLPEESVYGKCEALVKVVRTRMKTDEMDDDDGKNPAGKIAFFPRDNNANHDGWNDHNRTGNFHEMLSVKRTRNLETCYPIPGLLMVNSFFYHPMMTTVHYDVKSSISRTIVRDSAFTSYTTEDIAMRNVEMSGGNTTMLHVRTTLTLHSIEPAEKPIPECFNSRLYLVHELAFHSDFFKPSENDTQRPENSTEKSRK